MTERDKYIQTICGTLTERDELEAIAEEAGEVVKAALKTIRAWELSNNVTPVSAKEAEENLLEEILDLLCVLDVHGYDLTQLLEREKEYWKWERWANRLEGKDND